MKTRTVFALSLLAASLARATLIPDVLPINWAREDVSTLDRTRTPLAGMTYRIQGMAYISNTVPQDLSMLVIVLRTGDNATNLTWYGTPSLTTNGGFTCDVQFPTWTESQKYGQTRNMGIELTLVDLTNGVNMTYFGRKLFNVQLPMTGTNAGAINVSTSLIYVLPAVPSVFGRTGPITGTNGDYTAALVGAVATNDTRYLATVTNRGATVNGFFVTNGAAISVTASGSGSVATNDVRYLSCVTNRGASVNGSAITNGAAITLTAASVGAVATNAAPYLAIVTNGATPTFPAINLTGYNMSVGTTGGTNCLLFISGGTTNWILFQP